MNPLCSETITPHIAAIVLWHFRSGDPELWRLPSTGEAAVLTAATAVDPDLMRRLLFGSFTGLYNAIGIVRSIGPAELEAIARGEGVAA